MPTEFGLLFFLEIVYLASLSAFSFPILPTFWFGVFLSFFLSFWLTFITSLVVTAMAKFEYKKKFQIRCSSTSDSRYVGRTVLIHNK